MILKSKWQENGVLINMRSIIQKTNDLHLREQQQEYYQQLLLKEKTILPLFFSR